MNAPSTNPCAAPASRNHLPNVELMSTQAVSTSAHIDEPAPVSQTVTCTPMESLANLMPPIVSVWVPAHWRDMTETEDAALERFVRFLPVSPQLDHHGLLFLTRFVAPFFEGQDGVQVVPEQVVEAWDRHFARHQRPTTLPIVLASLRVIFGTAKVLVIGQLEIEHDATTGTLTLRRNAENYSRLLEFLVLLDGEVLA